MPVIRRQLKPSDVYPDDIRYNPIGDKVERLIDGEWKDAPESDPRTQTTLPPRITADSRCDAAQSISDALENQINGINTAIDNAGTVAQIAGLILGLFSFGVFAIFINLALALADYLLGLGTTAIEGALTPTVWETLRCILYCHIDEDGRIVKGDLQNIYDDIASQIGGVGSGILISFLSLAGEGGLNNLAAVGSATGDCSGCGCATTWCKLFDFSAGSQEWQALAAGAGGVFGSFSGSQWNGTDAVDTVSSPDISHRGIYLSRIFATRTVTRILLTYDLTKGSSDNVAGSSLRLTIGDIFSGTVLRNISFSTLVNGTNLTLEWTGSASMEEVQLWLFSSRDQTVTYTYSGVTTLKSVRMEGEGTNPFGVDDCP